MQAGQCTSCDAVVWLDEHGDCEVGGPEHVIEGRWDVDESTLPMGRGPLPDVLRRFCWPAFFLPVLWPLARDLGWLVGTLLLTNVVLILLLPLALQHPSYYPALGTVRLVVLLAASLWLGLKGNDVYWRRRNPRFPRKPETVADYARQQRVWFWIGLAIFGYDLWLTIGGLGSTLGLVHAALVLGAVAAAFALTRMLSADPSRALLTDLAFARAYSWARLAGSALLVLSGLALLLVIVRGLGLV